MEIEFTSRRENALLGREELEFVVTHPAEATPERDTVRDNIAAHVDANTGLVVVDHMDTEFGITETSGYAKVYDSVEALRDVENEYVLVRNGLSTGKEDEAEDEDAAPEPDEAEDDDGAPEPDEAEDAEEADEADEGDEAEEEDEAEEAEAEA